MAKKKKASASALPDWPEPGSPVVFGNLAEGQLVQDGNTVYKVSTVSPTQVTLILEHPTPPRTSVRTAVPSEIENRFKHISDTTFDRLTKMWDERARG